VLITNSNQQFSALLRGVYIPNLNSFEILKFKDNYPKLEYLRLIFFKYTNAIVKMIFGYSWFVMMQV